jgi:protein-S-isoprenylcysteine O-methyltransferase Ste14
MARKEPSKVKTIVKATIVISFLLALLFGSAGTFNWLEAWLFLILYLAAGVGGVIWLKRNDPDLLNERSKVKEDVKTWDKNIMLAYTFLIMIMLAVIGMDAVRFHWSQVPFVLKVFGFFCYIPAMVIIFLTMKHNAYLSKVVRIQEDRGHQVCTTGPYQYVRHPMYVGIILFMLNLPISLGSFYGLIPSFLIVLLFILRTSLEDKTLHKELPGYNEYAEKVRYKLIPGLW